MIVRRIDSDLLLITQPDHAALAAQFMEAWKNERFAQRTTRARVLEAVRLHDIGWAPVDASPGVDPANGTPWDFVTAPVTIRQRVWPRAVDELARRDPYVAALVAQHALTVYGRHTGAPEWSNFFQEMASRRDELLASEDLVFGDEFLHDYSVVRQGDLWSLAFCDWREDYTEMAGYRVNRRPETSPAKGDDTGVVEGGRLEIAPDPFGGSAVAISVRARRIPARRYMSDADLQSTISSAPVVRLAGLACGAAPVRLP